MTNNDIRNDIERLSEKSLWYDLVKVADIIQQLRKETERTHDEIINEKLWIDVFNLLKAEIDTRLEKNN